MNRRELKLRRPLRIIGLGIAHEVSRLAEADTEAQAFTLGPLLFRASKQLYLVPRSARSAWDASVHSIERPWLTM